MNILAPSPIGCQKWLLLLCIGLLAGCKPTSEQERFPGTLEWERVELIAEKSEPVTEVLVREGDWVTAGQVILKQDASRWQSRLERNRAEFGEAEARYAEAVEGPRSERLQEAEARYQGADQVFRIRQRELQRLEQVFERQFVSPDTVDKAQAALDAAKASAMLPRPCSGNSKTAPGASNWSRPDKSGRVPRPRSVRPASIWND
jgi:HlyD family secretion protein